MSIVKEINEITGEWSDINGYILFYVFNDNFNEMFKIPNDTDIFKEITELVEEYYPESSYGYTIEPAKDFTVDECIPSQFDKRVDECEHYVNFDDCQKLFSASEIANLYKIRNIDPPNHFKKFLL